MAVTVTITPSSGTALETAFKVAVSGLDDTDITTYSSGVTNSEDQITYYFEMSEAGVRKGKSHVFSGPSHEWDNIIAPDAGTYVFSVNKVSDDSTVGSASVTVS